MERIDTQRQDVGIVVGVIEPAGRRVIAYGSRAKGNARPLDGDTVFELASVTKAFTSLLLAEAVRRGEVSLTDPVSKYLPPTVKMPERGGRATTLHDLATHTSGLPREPANLQPKDPSNPFADYSVEQLYQFLSSYQLTRDIGVEFDYSNVGAGLLGHVLARRAGTDYGALVRSRITEPLGMRDTGTVFTPEMRLHLAVGHNRFPGTCTQWRSAGGTCAYSPKLPDRPRPRCLPQVSASSFTRSPTFSSHSRSIPRAVPRLSCYDRTVSINVRRESSDWKSS